jgi:hypothetical protein
MQQESALPQISLVVLLALVAVAGATLVVRETTANRQPRALSVIMDEVGASLAAPAAATTD